MLSDTLTASTEGIYRTEYKGITRVCAKARSGGVGPILNVCGSDLLCRYVEVSCIAPKATCSQNAVSYLQTCNGGCTQQTCCGSIICLSRGFLVLLRPQACDHTCKLVTSSQDQCTWGANSIGAEAAHMMDEFVALRQDSASCRSPPIRVSHSPLEQQSKVPST